MQDVCDGMLACDRKPHLVPVTRQLLTLAHQAHANYTAYLGGKILEEAKVKKIKGGVIALNGSPFQSYGASRAVWDPTVLPAT